MATEEKAVVMRAVRGVVVMAFALVTIANAALLAATNSPASGAVAQVVVQPCSGKPVVRPASFVIACGDGNSYLAKLKWSAWGDLSAKATGLYTVNNCTPYCAAGKFISSKAVVTLSKPKTVKGRRYFTNLHVGYVSGPKFTPFNFALLTKQLA